MNRSVFRNLESRAPQPCGNRALKHLAVVAFSILLCGPYMARDCRAQAPDETNTPFSQDQSVEAGSLNQSLSQDEQEAGSLNQSLPQDEQDDTQEAPNSVGTFGRMGVGTTPGKSNAPKMSADQIIAILQQDPGILAAAKSMVAQKLGTDPTTIADEEIYGQIRKDSTLRDQISQELEKRGYSSNPAQARMGSSSTSSQLQANQTRALSSRRSNLPTQPTQEPLELKAEKQESPYGDLPSLNDLYVQFPSASQKLKRFGSDAFQFGTGFVNDVPMDLPVGPDYVLGPGDGLAVNLWGGRSVSLNRIIDRQGQIALPEAGPVTIAGLTIEKAQLEIQKAMGRLYQDEHVEISPIRLRTVRVYVVGDVQRPGAYDISSLSTPLNALYAAGGPTSRGSMRIVKHLRGDHLVAEVDLYDLLLRGVRSDLDRLLSGDTILVPPVGSQVTVAGMVRRPAIYELKGDEGLNEALNLSGGVLVSASLRQIRVERVEAHQSRTMLSVNLPDDQAGQAEKLASFHVQDGDSVFVFAIQPYSEKAVYLQGHVYRPGKYPYHDGMTVSDVLRSYQDVLPEPADRAEIIRLRPPDFRPQTIDFNLPDALAGNDPIPLESFDVVRVFGRYDIDPPKVSIQGEVVRPGLYPMSQGMTVAGLVTMAGGFRRSAYREEADLSSYKVENGEKVLLAHNVVAISKALDGDKSADVPLKPGDVLGVRQLTGWQDIGASISIQGEVKFSGTYGIEGGERLSSVLKRAGGFRESAYPAGAELQRIAVRSMGERSRQEMIHRLETTNISVKPSVAGSQDQAGLQQSLLQQQQQILNALRSHPASGRLVIRISPEISQWENTPADIEVRAGDTLVIPKRPDFVMVMGQVYNSTAITYVPGKKAEWYLRQGGGVTQSGNKKAIFIVRADGSVVGHGDSGSVWSRGGVLDVRMNRGDALVVPDKIYGGSQAWRNVLATAQVMSSMAITAAAVGAF